MYETWWQGVAWPNEEAVTFWCGSESVEGSTALVSLSLNLQDAWPWWKKSELDSAILLNIQQRAVKFTENYKYHVPFGNLSRSIKSPIVFRESPLSLSARLMWYIKYSSVFCINIFIYFSFLVPLHLFVFTWCDKVLKGSFSVIDRNNRAWFTLHWYKNALKLRILLHQHC